MDYLDYLLFSSMPHPALRRDTDKKVRALNLRISRRLRSQYKGQKEREAALEQALGRVAMLARALAELGLAKGAFTREELERALVEADLADGEGDGVLDADVALPGEGRTVDLEPLDEGA
jgi:hypothetical protein